MKVTAITSSSCHIDGNEKKFQRLNPWTLLVPPFANFDPRASLSNRGALAESKIAKNEEHDDYDPNDIENIIHSVPLLFYESIYESKEPPIVV
jgi:hypothetical protein